MATLQTSNSKVRKIRFCQIPNFAKMSLNRQKECRESLHKTLHDNLRLLSLRSPMSADLEERFSEGMFRKPNSKAFNLCAHYLMSLIDERRVTADLAFFMCEPKMIGRFRRELLDFVAEVCRRHPGAVSPVSPSWLVTAGGYRAAKLMFELSQVALKIIAEKLKPSGEEAEEEEKTVEQLKDDLSEATASLFKYNSNIANISQLYEEQIALVEAYVERNKKTLKIFAQKAKVGDEIQDFMTDSELLKEWDEYIQSEMEKIESHWSESSREFLDVTKRCYDSSEEVIQKYTNKDRTDSTLEYDPNDDKLNSVKDDVVRDGTLHLPSLVKAYNRKLMEDFSAIVNFKIDSKYCEAMEKKAKEIKDKELEAQKLQSDIKSFHESLKKPKDMISFSFDCSEDDRWIKDILDVPTLNN